METVTKGKHTYRWCVVMTRFDWNNKWPQLFTSSLARETPKLIFVKHPTFSGESRHGKYCSRVVWCKDEFEAKMLAQHINAALNIDGLIKHREEQSQREIAVKSQIEDLIANGIDGLVL